MQIAEDHPMRGHSVPEWNRFFGNYLRDRDLENRPVRVFMPERQERARQRRIEMATLFKRDYDSWTFTAASVAALLYEEVGSSYIRAHTFRSTIRSLSSRRIMVIGGLAFRNTTQYPPNCGLQGPVRYRRFHAKSGGLVRLLSQSRMGCAGQDRSRREADGKRGMTVMGGSPTRMRKMRAIFVRWTYGVILSRTLSCACQYAGLTSSYSLPLHCWSGRWVGSSPGQVYGPSWG
jgi:hypothetical protein